MQNGGVIGLIASRRLASGLQEAAQTQPNIVNLFVTSVAKSEDETVISNYVKVFEVMLRDGGCEVFGVLSSSAQTFLDSASDDLGKCVEGVSPPSDGTTNILVEDIPLDSFPSPQSTTALFESSGSEEQVDSPDEVQLPKPEQTPQNQSPSVGDEQPQSPPQEQDKNETSSGEDQKQTSVGESDQEEILQVPSPEEKPVEEQPTKASEPKAELQLTVEAEMTVQEEVPPETPKEEEAPPKQTPSETEPESSMEPETQQEVIVAPKQEQKQEQPQPAVAPNEGEVNEEDEIDFSMVAIISATHHSNEAASNMILSQLQGGKLRRVAKSIAKTVENGHTEAAMEAIGDAVDKGLQCGTVQQVLSLIAIQLSDFNVDKLAEHSRTVPAIQRCLGRDLNMCGNQQVTECCDPSGPKPACTLKYAEENSVPSLGLSVFRNAAGNELCLCPSAS
eukprot:TRINITY_DN7682_c0_g1_i1.p1 TRINITY_DN7682_c0_g1~~TRINITY_DN7682_c0_g1_i1.p1  ORF type:complete len:491 (+),score=101.12 TRINITY_DN7682_c0_g1_i1:131-1474(+)